jgi:hypothetical protein
MKNFGINCQWRSETFFIVIFHFSIGKAAMNAFGNCAKGISPDPKEIFPEGNTALISHCCSIPTCWLATSLR